MAKLWKKYILWFAQEHVEFRNAEFNSIMKLFDLKHRKISENLMQPFWIVEFPNDEIALKYASRSIALRSVLEYWSSATTFSDFHTQLKNYIQVNKEVNTYFKAEVSFKITVETYNKHISQKEKVQRIESLDYLPIEGAVDLKTPQLEWWYIEFWGLDAVPSEPENILFGRLLAQGQRQLIKELSLKHRKFIGNTSMDAQLSLLMANQALVHDGDLVFDPFVGTGSLLVSAAKFGGYVLGADIDFMMLHARCRPSRITQKVRGKDENILANLKQYGCSERYLDAVVTDFSNPLWNDKLTFDSIITDPPYGIREAIEKVESKLSTKENSRSADMIHYPSTSHYALKHLYSDLLVFAAKHLKVGGRLVCWLPFHRDDYSEQMVPRHEQLILIANSEQRLTGPTSRRLLTFEKLDQPKCSRDLTQVDELTTKFRERYFENGIESRQERRLRKAEYREKGRLEAMKRGKLPTNSREIKCNLNRARFNIENNKI